MKPGTRKEHKISAEQSKVDGHRRAIREHIEKYQRLPDRDKYTALRTIENAQAQIRSIRSRQPSIRASYEDDWRP